MPSDLLKDLMKKAHQGWLVLPDFQRDFVWKPSDVIKLLASLLNGYPIGGLLFMESAGLYGYRLLDGVTEQEGQAAKDVVLVLDGQQRLTSCYRAFYGAIQVKDYPGRYYFNYKRYVENPEIAGSDVEDHLLFVRAKDVNKTLNNTASEQAQGLFPLDIIFNAPRGADYSAWLSGFTFSQSQGDAQRFTHFSQLQSRFIRTFIEPITSYQVHYEQIKRDTSSDVICTVFEAINTTGKRLTVFDLLVARCFPKDIRLRDWLQAAMERPIFRKFDGDSAEELCTTVLPRIIALHTKRTCRRGDLLDLSPDAIRDNWPAAVDALEAALHVLAERFGCLGLRFLPMADIIAPLALILKSEKFQDTQEQWGKISRWYWRSVFAQYFSGASDSKVAKTVKEWLGNGSGGGWLSGEGKEPESVREFSYRRTLLDDVSRVDTALYRGVMSMLLASDARDWGKEGKLLRRADWRDIQDHHIYPVRFLGPYGIKGNTVNNITNRTPLLSATNLAIGNDAPHVYLNNPDIVGTRGIPEEALRQHCASSAILITPFSKEVFEQFSRDRARRLLEHIGRLVEAEPLPDE
jgi:hypothetical protein